MQLLSNNQVKWLRSLQLKKHREAENLFVAEGEKMVLEGLESGSSRLRLLVSSSDYNFQQANSSTDALHFRANPVQLSQISSFKTPNKLLAVFERPSNAFPEKGLLLALDDIQDPGNMGTILRLADWFGVSGILCSENTVDCYNPKVIQASMGAIFRIPVKYGNLSEELQSLQLPVYGALLNGKDYSSVNYAENAVLLMGNEGQGISEELKQSITESVTIPRFGQAESLNVATATAILLAEIRR